MGSLKENSLTPQPAFLELGQYKEAITRINTGHQNLSELSAFIKERAAIEENYAAQLRKHANKYGEVIRKGGEYNTCRTAWMEALTEARQLADVHSTMSQALISQAQKKVSTWQKDHYTKKMMGGFKQVASYEKEFAKAQQEWQKLHKSQTKAKDSYYNACIQLRSAERNLQNLHGQLESATANGTQETVQLKIDKQKAVLHKKESDVTKTREAYKSAVIQCDDGRSRYEDDMKNVYDKTQGDEEQRLDFVREILFDVHQRLNIADSQKLREIYASNEHSLLKLDVKSDIEWWHNTRGMGIAMYWPTFEEYDPESAQKSIAHKQSMRSSKHVAGGSAVQAMSYKQNTNTFAEEFSQPALEAPKYETPELTANPFDREVNNNKITNGGDDQRHGSEISVEAIYEYEAQEEDEINLAAGMRLVQIEAEDDQGWCKGRLPDGVEGLYPANYVRPI